MKIIGIDIGNSGVKLGIVADREVVRKTHVPAGCLDQIPPQIAALARELDGQDDLPAVIASVVPEVCAHVVGELRKQPGVTPLVIGRDVPLPLRLDLKNATTVGVDRVLGAAAAYERVGQAVVVADFGTAVTIDCVNEDGVFLGGAILPGVATAARALARMTAALPEVSPRLPETPWGRDTAEAISVGIILGLAGALRELTERYATVLGRWPEVIATGGDAALVAENCDFVKAVVPDLVLMGVAAAYETWKAR